MPRIFLDGISHDIPEGLNEAPGLQLLSDALVSRDARFSAQAGKLNLLAYNAIGDSAADDTAKVQQGLDALATLNNGGTLFVPVAPGATGASRRYRVKKPLTCFGSQVTIEGADKWNTTIINLGDFFGPILYCGPDWGGIPTRTALLTGTGAAMDCDGTSDYYLNLSDAHTVNIDGLSAATVEFTCYVDADPSVSDTVGILSCMGARDTGMAASDFGGEAIDHTFTFRLQKATVFDGAPNQSALIGCLNVGGVAKTFHTGFLGTPFYLTNGVKHHCAVTYNGSAVKLWVDGVEIQSIAATGNIKQYVHNQWTLGTGISSWPSSYAAYQMIDGAADGVRISRTCRYTGTFTPMTAKPVWDSDTIFLHNFDNEQGVFSVGTARDSAASGTAVPFYMAVRKPGLGAAQATSQVILKNLRFQDGSGEGRDSRVLFMSSTNFEVSSCHFQVPLHFENNCFEGVVQNCLVSGRGVIGLLFGEACGVCAVRDTQIFGFAYQYVGNGGGGSLDHVLFTPDTSTIASVLQKSNDVTYLADSTVTFKDVFIDDESSAAGTYEAAGILSAMNMVAIIGGNFDCSSVASVPPLKVDGCRKVSCVGTSFAVFDDSTPVSVLHTPTKPKERLSFMACTRYKEPSVPWCDTAGYAMVDGNIGGQFTVSDAATAPSAISLGPTEPDTNYQIQVTPQAKSGSPAANSVLVETITKTTTNFTPNLVAAPGGGTSRTFDWNYRRGA